MAGGWFYAHEGDRLGPYSGERLKELAASGEILPTDTVWKAGVDEGVQASQVVNLFRPAQVNVVESAPAQIVAESAPPPAAASEEAKPRTKYKARATAVAVKGAVMVGQDGVDARYRMKCDTCGHADSSCRTFRIMAKTVKSGFFCPKCKKRREVVIQGRIA
jgi:hypothetical protein